MSIKSTKSQIKEVRSKKETVARAMFGDIPTSFVKSIKTGVSTQTQLNNDRALKAAYDYLWSNIQNAINSGGFSTNPVEVPKGKKPEETDVDQTPSDEPQSTDGDQTPSDEPKQDQPSDTTSSIEIPQNVGGGPRTPEQQAKMKSAAATTTAPAASASTAAPAASAPVAKGPSVSSNMTPAQVRQQKQDPAIAFARNQMAANPAPTKAPTASAPDSTATAQAAQVRKQKQDPAIAFARNQMAANPAPAKAPTATATAQAPAVKTKKQRQKPVATALALNQMAANPAPAKAPTASAPTATATAQAPAVKTKKQRQKPVAAPAQSPEVNPMAPSNGVPLYTPSSLTTQPKPRIRMPAGKKLVETTGDANYRKLNLLFENIISVIYEDEELPPLSNYVVKLVNNLVDGIPKENMTKVQSLAAEIQNGVKDQKVLKNKIIELSKLAMVLYPSTQIDKSGKSPEKPDAKSDDKKKEKEVSSKTLIKRLLEELTELTKKYTRQNREIPVSPEIEDIINKLSAISDSIRNTSGISLFGNQKAKTIEDNIKTLKKKIKDKRSLPVSDIEFLSPPLKSISNDL